MNNSLAELCPDLVKEWDSKANYPLCPENVTCKSGKKVWWVCENDHRWLAVISHRTAGSACPYCSGRTVAQDETDLKTIAPSIASEWHPTMNGTLYPTMVTVGSHKEVYWICNEGHIWKAKICDRTRGFGCPYCHGRKVDDSNSLSMRYPQIAAEWHPALNKGLTPNDVTPGSHKLIWWQCDKGHEWQARVYSRSSRGCPVCSNKKIVAGVNDLATVNPTLFEEWHPTRNGEITPQMVACNSTRKVWWQGKCGHEWQARISHRNAGVGCPVCSGRVVQPGINDLATVDPKISAEWHPTRNGEKTPSMFASGSGYNAWWKCSYCGFEWQTPVTHRVRRQQKCPACNGVLRAEEKLI